MYSRRDVLGLGFRALALGALAGKGLGRPMLLPPCAPTGALPVRPVIESVPDAPASIQIGGLPFAPGWFGDPWDRDEIPFHRPENMYPGGIPPAVSERVKVAVVGGGLSGLAAAVLLREHRPVVFELRERFGGVSMGERWRGTSYSLGGAYFIAPDPGTFLHRFYRGLGLSPQVRVSPSSDDKIEVRGRIEERFWEGSAVPAHERPAFARYAAMVRYFMEHYPEIPLVPGKNNRWIRELDGRSLKEDVESRLGGPAPDLLMSAIQGYCYSSFGAGWEEVSAASGWNFIAAEEFGRWVLPGGNAGLAQAMMERLSVLEAGTPPGCPPRYLRAGCRVVEVRVDRERVVVVYRDSAGTFRSLEARAVVMACPKFVCRYLMPQLHEDPHRLEDLHRLRTMAYLVANVLLEAPIGLDFYDLFMLREGGFPQGHRVEEFARAIDVVRGDFARRGPRTTGVLTFYWPLPFPSGRMELLAPEDFERVALRLRPELDLALSLLGLDRRAVRQIRLARWGHAMPIADVGLIAEGVCERIREPWRERVFFVCQDNWALPAVETCLLEAEAMRPRIERVL